MLAFESTPNSGMRMILETQFYSILAFKDLGEKAAILMGVPWFKASNYFLHQFKRRYKVTSCKIKRYLTLDTALKTRALEFVREVTDYISANAIDADMVLNTDPSRFEYKIISNRTTYGRGKDDWRYYSKRSITTHSYTIHMFIFMSGCLAKKLYICFQEAGGKFGKLVSDTLQRNQPPI